jgi:multidrug resistance efflux pump
LLGLVSLALAAVAANWALHGSPAGAAPDEAKRAASGLRVVCFGHVDLEHGVTSLYPAVPGRVTAVAVNEADTVSAGQVLVRLDDALARLRMQEAEADLTSAQEQLSEAGKLPEHHRLKVTQQKAAVEAIEHRLTGARSVLERKRELARIDQLNPREVEAAESLLRELDAVERAERGKLRELELSDPNVGIHRAQADVDAKRARLEQARRGVDECVLKAPADGTVLRVLVSAGEVLGPQPKQPAILFCPNGRRIIRAEVEQEFAGRVAAGQRAWIEDDASAGPTWHGQIRRISDWYTHRRSILQEPFQFNDVRTLECLITLDPGQPQLRIGQRVRVSIEQEAPAADETRAGPKS